MDAAVPKRSLEPRHADTAIQGGEQQHYPCCEDCLPKRVYPRIQVSSSKCYEVPRTSKCPQQRVHNVLCRRPQEIIRCPPGRVSLGSYHTCFFVTFACRQSQQRKKLAHRQGHPCLRFFHDFASAVIPNFRSFLTCTNASFLTRSYTCSFVTFTSERLQQRKQSARR